MEIERENKILAEKVINIIKRPPPDHMKQYNNLFLEWAPQILALSYKKLSPMSHASINNTKTYKQVKFHQQKQQKDLQVQNIKILKRLQDQKSVYDIVKWD